MHTELCGAVNEWSDLMTIPYDHAYGVSISTPFIVLHMYVSICIFSVFLSLSPCVCIILCMCVYYVSIYLACCYGLSHWLHVTIKFFPIFAYQTFHTLFLCVRVIHEKLLLSLDIVCVNDHCLPFFFHNDFGSAFACTIQCLILSHWQSGVALIGCFF